jgi:hypothetical protein
MARIRSGSNGFSRGDLALSLVGALSLLTAGLQFINTQTGPSLGSRSTTVWDMQNAVNQGRFTPPKSGFATQWGYRVIGAYGDWRPLRVGGEIDLVKNGFLGLENSMGDYALDLRGNPGASGNSGVTQRLGLVPGQRYQLSFEVANVTDHAQAGVSVLLDGALLLQVTPGAQATRMTRHERLFQVPAHADAHQQLTLRAFGVREGEYGVFVDNVQINRY